MNEKRVVVIQAEKKSYPNDPPFHPPEKYPEYPFDEIDKTNTVYKAVRELLYHLGLDIEQYGTAQWNPFKEMIQPGNTVVIKPNLVLDAHTDGENLYSMITHPSVLRALVDYCYIALNGTGRLIIADTPLGHCDFNHLLLVTKLPSISEFYKKKTNFEISIFDLRKMMYPLNEYQFTECDSTITLNGDPLGYTIVDLGQVSQLSSIQEPRRFQGTDYNRQETIRHHRGNRHEYLIPNTILRADVIISVPKLKVHKKAGVTLNLKNMVGISGDKNYLPHFQLGSPKKGGDEIPDDLSLKLRLQLRLLRLASDYFLSHHNILLDKIVKTAAKLIQTINKNFINDVNNKISPGNWHFNDTIWRVIIDLNQILLYADTTGILQSARKRKYFSIIDGIIGGEQEGPVHPIPKPCGVLIGGFDPYLVDITGTTLMGFEYKKIPQYRNLPALERYKISGYTEHDIEIITNVIEFEGLFKEKNNQYFNFKPPRGWKDHL
jgi:uncharacterized protein (DUF362 family)